MDMSVEITDKPGCLYATLTGMFGLQAAKETFVEILTAVERHRATRVLVDARTLKGEPLVIERFVYGEFVALAVRELTKQAISPLPRFAYVMTVPVLDKDRFGELVARNRGMSVKAFDTMADAFNWLG